MDNKRYQIMAGRAVIAVKNVPTDLLVSEVRPLSQKEGNLRVFSVESCKEGVVFSFVYANGLKVDKHDVNKECQRIALKHSGNPEKSRVLEAVFVRQRFGHQHFGSMRKGITRGSSSAQPLMLAAEN